MVVNDCSMNYANDFSHILGVAPTSTDEKNSGTRKQSMRNMGLIEDGDAEEAKEVLPQKMVKRVNR